MEKFIKVSFWPIRQDSFDLELCTTLRWVYWAEGTNEVIKNLGQMYSFPCAKNEKIPNDSLLPKWPSYCKSFEKLFAECWTQLENLWWTFGTIDFQTSKHQNWEHFNCWKQTRPKQWWRSRKIEVFSKTDVNCIIWWILTAVTSLTHIRYLWINSSRKLRSENENQK